VLALEGRAEVDAQSSKRRSPRGLNRCDSKVDRSDDWDDSSDHVPIDSRRSRDEPARPSFVGWETLIVARGAPASPGPKLTSYGRRIGKLTERMHSEPVTLSQVDKSYWKNCGPCSAMSVPRLSRA